MARSRQGQGVVRHPLPSPPPPPALSRLHPPRLPAVASPVNAGVRFRGSRGRSKGLGSGSRCLCHRAGPGVFLSGTEAPGRVAPHLLVLQEGFQVNSPTCSPGPSTVQSLRSGCAQEGRALPGPESRLAERSQPGSARAHVCCTLKQGTRAPQPRVPTARSLHFPAERGEG